MIVEGLFSDSGFGESVLKEARDKILENSGLSGVKSHRGSAKVESVWPWSWRGCLMIYHDMLWFTFTGSLLQLCSCTIWRWFTTRERSKGLVVVWACTGVLVRR